MPVLYPFVKYALAWSQNPKIGVLKSNSDRKLPNRRWQLASANYCSNHVIQWNIPITYVTGSL